MFKENKVAEKKGKSVCFSILFRLFLRKSKQAKGLQPIQITICDHAKLTH